MSLPLWITEGSLLVVTVCLLNDASWLLRWRRAERELDGLFRDCYLMGYTEGMHACAESRKTIRLMAKANKWTTVVLAMTFAIILFTYLKMR